MAPPSLSSCSVFPTHFYLLNQQHTDILSIVCGYYFSRFQTSQGQLAENNRNGRACSCMVKRLGHRAIGSILTPVDSHQSHIETSPYLKRRTYHLCSKNTARNCSMLQRKHHLAPSMLYAAVVSVTLLFYARSAP